MPGHMLETWFEAAFILVVFALTFAGQGAEQFPQSQKQKDINN